MNKFVYKKTEYCENCQNFIVMDEQNVLYHGDNLTIQNVIIIKCIHYDACNDLINMIKKGKNNENDKSKEKNNENSKSNMSKM